MPTVPNRDQTEANQTDDSIESIRAFRDEVTSQTKSNRVLWLALGAIALFSIVILIFVHLDRMASNFANSAKSSPKSDTGSHAAQISPVQEHAAIVSPKQASSNSEKSANSGNFANSRAKAGSDDDRQSRLHVTGAVANIRAGPSINHKVVARLKRGTEVVEISRTGKWVHIGIPTMVGQRGWIHASLVASGAFKPGPKNKRAKSRVEKVRLDEIGLGLRTPYRLRWVKLIQLARGGS